MKTVKTKYILEFDTDPTISFEITKELVIGDFVSYDKDGEDHLFTEGLIYKRELHIYDAGNNSSSTLFFYVKT